MNEAAKPPPGPWQTDRAPESTGKTPGASLGLMIGVVSALLLAAVLAWVAMGLSGVS